MESSTTYSNLVNYESTTSNSTNYINGVSSASPESIPELLENGYFVKYEVVHTPEAESDLDSEESE